jgi:alpha-glucosidase
VGGAYQEAVVADSHLWWQNGVIYQIYPRSFMDSNGDGVGDLPGIRSRLDYVQWLGVDAIWISPIFPSPMADFGYDVADYTDIEPLFGTLGDFDRLLADAHERGLKVMLDLVPNHTSDRHAWFQESRSSRDNPKRDWYMWRDAKPDGSPPNNWLGNFGGSGWEWDAATGQYYYHSFLKEQPDLNYRNPAVVAAMCDVLRFWLDRGVDGFRVDVIYYMMKDGQWRDNPPNPRFEPGDNPYLAQEPRYTYNQPEVHGLIRRFREVFDAYPERMMVGEIYLPYDELMKYYGAALDECHMPFNFELINLPWEAAALRAKVEAYEAALPPGGWPNWVLGNHDQHRIASRVGRAQARVAQMLLLTLRGTPTCYYGDELGMRDVDIPPEAEQDPFGRNVPGLGLGRDPERTPMQWDTTPHAGFTQGTPWLPVAADYKAYNVQVERGQADSTLQLVRRLLQVRRATPALNVGRYETVQTTAPDVLAYLREADGRRMLIALNLGATEQRLDLSAVGASGTVAVSTHMDREGAEALDALRLRADEGLVLSLPDRPGAAIPG